MDKQLSDLHDNLGKQSRIKILNAISAISSQAHHKAASKDRLKGSGKWLLEKEIFQDWRSESASSVLWLHGIPGSGKTKLVSLVSDELRSNVHVAYFYCMRNPAEPERAECDKLTHILNESQSLVKIFISSRDNIDIVMRLQGSPNLHIGAQEKSLWPQIVGDSHRWTWRRNTTAPRFCRF
jgi:predicted ATPase